MSEKKQYQKEYEEFMDSYKKTVTSGEDVGVVIARLAQYYGDVNLQLGACDEELNKVFSEISDSVDENTMKPISMAKAEIKTKDTDEYKAHAKVKSDIQNIEQYINALKYLQKGVLNEYSHIGA